MPKIFVEWATSDGGLGVTAFTDEKRLSYLGIYPLNCIGKPSGLPCWLRRSCFMSDVVVGFKKASPILVFANAQVSSRGISLIISVPFDVGQKYQRHIFAPWGSEAPRYGFTLYPSKNRMPVSAFPAPEQV